MLDAFGVISSTINAMLPRSALATIANPALTIAKAHELVVSLAQTIKKHEEEQAIEQDIFHQRIHSLEDKVG
jgi:hypothetical protein